MLKIVKTVTSCKECPQRAYFSGGQYECRSMDGAPLPASCDIPAWCPLQDHPGKLAAVADAKVRNAQADEVFLGNVETEKGIPDYLTAAGLKTVRLGERAMDIDGNDLPHHQPMFIGRAESDAYHRIMMKRTFPNQHVW